MKPRRVQKMDKKYMFVGSSKTNNPEKKRPRIRITGRWLNTIGFENETIAKVQLNRGEIVIKYVSNGMNNYKMLSLNSNDGSNYMIVRNMHKGEKCVPYIEMKGYWLSEYGFDIGDMLSISYTYGVIKIDTVYLGEPKAL
jgi:hypothetical protein